jgi:hypothetical protein
MKKLILLSGVAGLLITGCASDQHHYTHYKTHTDYYNDRQVVVDPNDRVHVREYDSGYVSPYRGNDSWNHRTYRGKHPDALGWNDPYWNR